MTLPVLHITTHSPFQESLIYLCFSHLRCLLTTCVFHRNRIKTQNIDRALLKTFGLRSQEKSFGTKPSNGIREPERNKHCDFLF